MRKKMSTAAKVRRMIEKGYTTKDIAEKLKVKPQVVYNIRYQVNKERGLGAIGKPAPTPADGIGTPPPKPTKPTKPTRKVRAGTGITAPDASAAPSPEAIPVLTQDQVIMSASITLPNPAATAVAEVTPAKLPWKERIKNVMRLFGWKG